MFSLTSLAGPLPIEVVLDPEWESIHEDFSPIVRLALVEMGGRALTPRPCAPSSNGEKVGGSASGANSPGTFPKVMSPVRPSSDAVVLASLTAPINVDLPPAMTEEEQEAYNSFFEAQAAKERNEKAYIAFVFDEYKKRKTIELKYTHAMEKVEAALAEARRRDLPPYVRNLLAEIEKAESRERESLLGSYDTFLQWVEEMIPQWLEAVAAAVEEREHQEEAKRKALAAAKEALAQELAEGKLTLAPAGRPSNAAGTYSPDVQMEEDMGAEDLSPSALRRKAIRMLEMEEVNCKRRREEQLQELQRQEDALRRQVEEKQRTHDAEAAARKAQEVEQRRRALAQEEALLAARIQQRDAERSAKEEERQKKLEHIKAEEELLRQRLQERDNQRKAVEEEAKRQEALQRAQKYNEAKAEEERLRRRIQEREEARAAQQRELAQAEQEKQRRAVQEEAVRRSQEEALEQAKSNAARREREEQLRYLQEQERLYKTHMHAKEMAEIHARHPTPVLPSTPYNPPPPAAYPMPSYGSMPGMYSNGYAPPPPPAAAPYPGAWGYPPQPPAPYAGYSPYPPTAHPGAAYYPPR